MWPTQTNPGFILSPYFSESEENTIFWSHIDFLPLVFWNIWLLHYSSMSLKCSVTVQWARAEGDFQCCFCLCFDGGMLTRAWLCHNGMVWVIIYFYSMNKHVFTRGTYGYCSLFFMEALQMVHCKLLNLSHCCNTFLSSVHSVSRGSFWHLPQTYSVFFYQTLWQAA